ncbi:outer membrane protein [Helicobacter acinonychis]|uniref:Outer membrane protein 33 n=2 Tax=Helicobacter acinonychis TaxID=212 RepID=Q17V61_HELAH|nr:outer membrane protein [Helicobacter acinonychis]CAK00465.1 outer membrane protein 33 [Helicobacter acinonychis str. Sheeba]SFZ70425.1 OMP1604 [Helicobacter acinonychis]SFZ70687.1 OMP285 [Helicobacter acinonychis]SFZ70934.1 OMP983 [Helicobacter acinonychis]STP05025.1 outer membrane protein 33 [Helicobacter acinonychis]
MKNFFSKPLLALVMSVNTLLAMDSNGVFIGAGYLQGEAQMHANINSHKQVTSAPIRGFDVNVGYQFFFGKYFGLRAYGFLDYARASSLKLKNPNYKNSLGKVEQLADQIGEDQADNTLSQVNRLSNLANPKIFSPNMLTYGGAMDLMVNFINNGIMSLGVFGGVQFAGNSWIMSTPSFEGFLVEQALVSKKPTSFQFLFNVGARIRVLKHSSIEAGVKFPMLKKNPYITAKDLDMGFRRVYSWYVNYVFTF